MSLTVYIGPMFGGKSENLIKSLVKEKIFRRENSLMVCPKIDNREFFTHFPNFSDLSKDIDFVKFDTLEQAHQTAEKYDVVGIDECQFFTLKDNSFLDCINEWIKKGKNVYCAGLKADYKQQPFGNFLNILAMADSIVECPAICKECIKECNERNETLFIERCRAQHTKRVSGGSDQVLIGAEQEYIPVCRRHHV